jgi:hypothetical protein
VAPSASTYRTAVTDRTGAMGIRIAARKLGKQSHVNVHDAGANWRAVSPSAWAVASRSSRVSKSSWSVRDTSRRALSSAREIIASGVEVRVSPYTG